jgi:hypothetical protein
MQAPHAEIHDTHMLTEEPSMGISRDGRMYIDTINPSKPGVATSTDWGKTWTDVSPGHARTFDPYLYVDPATGRVFEVDYQLVCHSISFSDNAGKAWTTNNGACEITDHENLVAGPAPNGGAKPTGYPNVVYECGNGGGIGVVFFSHVAQLCDKSLDGGVTWQPTGTPPFSDAAAPHGTGDGEVPGNCNADSGHAYVGPDGTL